MTEAFHLPRGCSHELQKFLVLEPRSYIGLECRRCEGVAGAAAAAAAEASDDLLRRHQIIDIEINIPPRAAP